MKLNLQIYSDYHIEWHYPKEPFKYKIQPLAPVLVLAGDICSVGSGTDKYFNALKRFLEYVSNLYILIIYVPGNHEYYNFSKNKLNWLTINEIDNKLLQLCNSFNNVKYLSNSGFKFTMNKGDNKQVYRFLGTPLWGFIPNSVQFDIEAHKNDFYQISAKKGQNITVPELNNEHVNAIKFLNKEIQKAIKKNEIIIIITHHQPYITKENFCFHDMSLDTMELIKPPVKLWIMGHMHGYRNIKLNGVRIVENGIGYPNERTGYKKDLVIKI